MPALDDVKPKHIIYAGYFPKVNIAWIGCCNGWSTVCELVQFTSDDRNQASFVS